MGQTSDVFKLGASYIDKNVLQCALRKSNALATKEGGLNILKLFTGCAYVHVQINIIITEGAKCFKCFYISQMFSIKYLFLNAVVALMSYLGNVFVE